MESVAGVQRRPDVWKASADTMEDNIPGKETGQRLEPPPALKRLAAGAGIETARGPNVEGKPGGWEWECGSIEPLEHEGSSVAREGGGRGGRGVALREERPRGPGEASKQCKQPATITYITQMPATTREQPLCLLSFDLHLPPHGCSRFATIFIPEASAALNNCVHVHRKCPIFFFLS